MSRRTLVVFLLLTLYIAEISAMLTGLCMGQYCFGHRMYLPSKSSTNTKRSSDWMAFPGGWMNRQQFGELQRYVTST